MNKAPDAPDSNVLTYVLQYLVMEAKEEIVDAAKDFCAAAPEDGTAIAETSDLIREKREILEWLEDRLKEAGSRKPPEVAGKSTPKG